MSIQKKWTNDRPNEPGWWWYEDEYYGPAPVYLDWSGFRNIPDSRSLDVDMAISCGECEDENIIGVPVSELFGLWYPLDSVKS